MLNELTVNFVSNKRTQTELYLFWSSGVAILRDKKTFDLKIQSYSSGVNLEGKRIWRKYHQYGILDVLQPMT